MIRDIFPITNKRIYKKYSSIVFAWCFTTSIFFNLFCCLLGKVTVAFLLPVKIKKCGTGTLFCGYSIFLVSLKYSDYLYIFFKRLQNQEVRTFCGEDFLKHLNDIYYVDNKLRLQKSTYDKYLIRNAALGTSSWFVTSNDVWQLNEYLLSWPDSILEYYWWIVGSKLQAQFKTILM